jgi:outer membrane protein insertion porin family
MDYLRGPTRERFPKLKEIVDLPFVESDVVQGIKLVERLYSAEGFLDAVVNDPEFVLTEDNTQADITLVIVEGTKYTFGPVRFEGNVVFPPGQLLVEIADVASDVFTDGRMAAARRKVEDFYREHGYYAAEVEAVGKPEQAGYDGQVPVTFWIDSGPVYRFDGITVSGNSGVRESFLRQRFAWMQGRVYNPELVDKQFRELIETGLFRDLGIDPKPIEGDQLRLDITVKEARPKEFGIGIGFATFYGGIFSLSYGDRNFLRSGRPFEAKIELNQRGYSGEVTYRDPWFLEKRYKLLLRAHALNEQFDGYLKQESGAQARLSRNFNEHWEVSAYVKGKHVTVEDIKIEPVELAGPDEYTVAAIGFSQSIDYRNNPLLPTRGFIFDVAAEFAPNGLSDFSYIRAVGRFSWHIQVTERSSFALGARGGTIAPLARQDVPIDERFFVGGATTVRSFAERELGPQDARGHPIGGRTYSVFNAEYTFPIVGDLQGAVFFDAGNLMPRTGEWGADSMRYAVGAGLRYNLPIGALRFDYGHNPSPVEGENSGAFHLAIGFAF